MNENDKTNPGKRKPLPWVVAPQSAEGPQGQPPPQPSDRFRVFHLTPTGSEDQYGHSSDEFPVQPNEPPEEYARHRRYLRWLSLATAANELGWPRLLKVWLAVSINNTLDALYRRLDRVPKRDELEDPTLRDVIALALIEIGPTMPRWAKQQLNEWDKWRERNGIPDEYQKLVKPDK